MKNEKTVAYAIVVLLVLFALLTSCSGGRYYTYKELHSKQIHHKPAHAGNSCKLWTSTR